MSLVGTRPILQDELEQYELHGASEKLQKIGCYVQKCAVICAITEEVNLSWEGW